MSIFKKTEFMFLMVGLLMLASAAYFYSEQSDFLQGAETAEGKVVDIIRLRRYPNDHGIRYKYQPVIKFTDRNNAAYEFKSSVGSDRPRYSKMDDVSILYNPDNPSDAIIDNFFARWMWVFLLGGLGSIFLMIAAGLHLKRN